jgi:GntR family transcriptional regulator / MocR family aminotransferase
MRRWMLSIALDSNKEQPLFLQLARVVGDDIRRGRLRPGEPLPGSRELASCLGINRNTVIAGYQELESEGLISARMGGGTFVSKNFLPVPASNSAALDKPTYTLGARQHPSSRQSVVAKPGAFVLSMSVPDARLFPARQLARAFRRAIEIRRRAALQHSDPCGHPRLRTELATMLSRTRGLDATSDNVMITRSIEQGIDLVARTLIAPGDVVVVEAFGYPPAWSVLKLAGARLIPLPLDAEGLDIDALESLLQQQHIRAVFVTPHHQFPTTAVMSSRRRERLADLSMQSRFAIIEDDYDHEFHYQGKPILPIGAGPNRANVIYVGSLANVLAPGISTGFVVAPPMVFQHLAGLRASSDSRSDAAIECAIAELFEDGELLRHVLRIRRTYANRRDALAAALKKHVGSALSFRVPHGGMAIWAQVEPGIDLQQWSLNGEAEGVVFSGAQVYDFFHREQPYLRLGFSYHDELELSEAVRRMARALPREKSRIARSPLGRMVRDEGVDSIW